MNRYPRLTLFLPVWLAVVVYLPSLLYGYVWDDTYFLTDMPFLRDPALWWEHIQQPLFVSRNYFRPLPLLMFVFEARIGDLSPFVFHLVNVLLHGLNTLLVMLLTEHLLSDRRGGADDHVHLRPRDGGSVWRVAAAGLLFALHPAVVENVSWISDRFDLMMVTCILAALLAERRIARPALRAGVMGLLFVAAMLSKETAILLLVLLPLWQLAGWFNAGARFADIRAAAFSGPNLKLYAALMLALFGYFMLRHAALGFFYSADAQMRPGGGLQHALLVGKTVGWYFSLLVWPFGQTSPVHPGVTPVPLDDIGAWLGLASLLTAVPWLLFHAWRGKVAAVVTLAALAALAPVSNLVPLTIADNIVHDRYLILPIAFAAIALAVVLQNATRHFALWRPLAPAALASWLVAALATVLLTAPHWENNLTLWAWGYGKHPDSRIARANYISALVVAQKNAEAVELCESLLKSFPRDTAVLHNLALALARVGRLAEAEPHVLRVIELSEAYDAKTRMDKSEALNLLAYIYIHQKRWQEAETVLHQAIEITPYLTRPHYNLALVLYERGDWEGGDKEVAFAVHYGAPELAAAHKRLAEKRKAELMKLNKA